MTSISTRIFLFFLAVSLVGPGLAQDKKGDTENKVQVTPQDKFILDMFSTHRNKTLCMLGDVPIATVRRLVVEQLKASGLAEGATATSQQIENAVWTLFPCPFSPYRAEVRLATAKDIEGVWLFPHDSQPYRYGQDSSQQPTSADAAVACEAVGYYPKGELRTGVVMGANTPCPFTKAAVLDAARKRPRIFSWAMVRDGRLKVTRTDVKDHIEEWDVHVATKPFAALNLEIKAGDLITYLRRDKDNDVNAATEFRHLQRLK